MDRTQELRRWLHDLRNLLGDVIGLSEVILEDIDEVGGGVPPGLTDGLHTVRTVGRRVAARLNTAPEGLLTMRPELLGLVDQLAVQCTRLHETGQADSVLLPNLKNDLKKMSAALENFRLLLHSGS